MLKKNGLSLVALMFAVMLVFMAGCGKDAARESKAAKPGAEGEKEDGGKTLTIEEVLKARCSHGLTIECAECRYEVGVVKVNPSLIAQAGGSSTGLVKTIRVAKQKITTAVNITGEIAVNENAAVHLSPRISGIINTVNVDIGARVRKDDILFTVDSVELGEALSDYEKNIAMAALSGKTFQREKALFEQKIGSESEMIEAQMRFEEYQASLKVSEQKLHVLGLSEGDIAAIAPTNHASLGGSLAVRAPISGTIIEKHAVSGELVEPGKDVMILADLTTAWVWGGIYDRDLAGVLARMAPKRRPFPSCSPSQWLRPERQVVTRSPNPLNPQKVCACAPMATPSRAISTTPRVTSAAFAFAPNPRPSLTPVAMAIGFFSAPPSSTPATSVDV